MHAEARAKVNLSLRVGARRDTRHLVHSIACSVDWADLLDMRLAGEDVLDAVGAPVPLDEANLIWAAVHRIRREGPTSTVSIRLEKRIPMAAGLGGGSADAAAALVLYARLTAYPSDRIPMLAAEVGSDVPFCLIGGLARVQGTGESVSPVGRVPDDHCLALVVPPFSLATGEVYASWDVLGGPSGREVSGRYLPPSLRDLGPFANDLYPAAAHRVPELDDWRRELEEVWGRPVLLSGSGPALFAFFQDTDEAEDALSGVREPVRARRVATPTRHGVLVS